MHYPTRMETLIGWTLHLLDWNPFIIIWDWLSLGIWGMSLTRHTVSYGRCVPFLTSGGGLAYFLLEISAAGDSGAYVIAWCVPALQMLRCTDVQGRKMFVWVTALYLPRNWHQMLRLETQPSLSAGPWTSEPLRGGWWGWWTTRLWISP